MKNLEIYFDIFYTHTHTHTHIYICCVNIYCMCVCIYIYIYLIYIYIYIYSISTGASDRSFYSIFNKRFDHLETMLTICRPKKFLSAGSLCRCLLPSPQSKCPKWTFMLPQKYHVSVSNMLSKPLKYFMENET